MPETTQTAFDLPPGLPPDWVLDRDLPCPQCRYNLRGLREARCPECGGQFRWQALLDVICPRCGADLCGFDGDTCPRCRLTLNWPLLLSASGAAGTETFEYGPRPVRASLFRRPLLGRLQFSGTPQRSLRGSQ